MARLRLDQLLVERGLFQSREKARRAVMAGLVLVDGQRVDKAGTQVPTSAETSVVRTERFVSRAGYKLEHALEVFDLDPKGLICVDIGASTGGFCDCLLQRGAARIYAIDVGYGQLDSKVALDSRVVVMDRLNARYLEADGLPEQCDLATIDVSFISVMKILPALLPHIRPGGYLLPMLKPQFEVGREGVGKGGIVRDEQLRRATLERRVEQISELVGAAGRGLIDNELTGATGNREAFTLFQIPGEPEGPQTAESESGP